MVTIFVYLAVIFPPIHTNKIINLKTIQIY